MFRNLKIMLIVIVIVVLAASAYAFAAANTVPASKAGSGSGTVSGYTVSNVAYVLNTTTPTTLDAVTLTLDSAATSVQIKLVSAGSTWYTCAVVTGNNWTCDTTADHPTVSSVDQLTVVAAQ